MLVKVIFLIWHCYLDGANRNEQIAKGIVAKVLCKLYSKLIALYPRL